MFNCLRFAPGFNWSFVHYMGKKDLEKNKKRELLIMESREKLSLILNKGFESYISE